MQDISRRGSLKVARNGVAAAGIVAVAPATLLATAAAAVTPKAAKADAAAGALFDVGSTEPQTAASVGAFGLHHRSDFPNLADPWVGNDNPSSQVRAMAD